MLKYTLAGMGGLLVLAAVLATVFWDELQMIAIARMKLTIPYEDLPLPPRPDYSDPASWAEHTATAVTRSRSSETAAPAEPLPVDVFYIHPTTYLGNAYWNAPIDEPDALARLEHVLEVQAGPFRATGRIFAPLYRQAAIGAALAANDDTVKALKTAYEDVRRAFRHFIRADNAGRPFILVGHSQGTALGLRLLADDIADTPLAERLIAAYLPGGRISVTGNLDPLPDIEPCRTPVQIRCVVGWQTFASGGDPSYLIRADTGGAWHSAKARAGIDLLCTNPVSWRADTAPAPRQAHLGAVSSSEGSDGTTPAPIPRLFSARCGKDGFLYVDPAPEAPFAETVLPGGNYHVYDIHLFYMDIRANARARAEAFLAQWRETEAP